MRALGISLDGLYLFVAEVSPLSTGESECFVVKSVGVSSGAVATVTVRNSADGLPVPLLFFSAVALKEAPGGGTLLVLGMDAGSTPSRAMWRNGATDTKLYAWKLEKVRAPQLALAGVSLLSNSATTGYGGGLALESVYLSPELRLSDLVATGNRAGGDGGALALLNLSSEVRVLGSVITANSAGARGGAVSARFAAAATLSNCTFANNTAGSAAGVYFSSTTEVTMACILPVKVVVYDLGASRVNISGSTFRANVAAGAGLLPGAAVVELASRATAAIGDSLFEDNAGNYCWSPVALWPPSPAVTLCATTPRVAACSPSTAPLARRFASRGPTPCGPTGRGTGG